MMVPSDDSSILAATRGGMGKRSAVDEYRRCSGAAGSASST